MKVTERPKKTESKNSTEPGLGLKWVQPPMKEAPDEIPIAASVHLISLKGMAYGFGLELHEAEEFLRYLKVPLLETPNGIYFNLMGLELCLIIKSCPWIKTLDDALKAMRKGQEIYTAASKAKARLRLRQIKVKLFEAEETKTKRAKWLKSHQKRLQPF